MNTFIVLLIVLVVGTISFSLGWLYSKTIKLEKMCAQNLSAIDATIRKFGDKFEEIDSHFSDIQTSIDGGESGYTNPDIRVTDKTGSSINDKGFISEFNY